MKTFKLALPVILCALCFVIPSTFAAPNQDQCPDLTTTSTVPSEWYLSYGTLTGNNHFNKAIIRLSTIVGCFYDDNAILLMRQYPGSAISPVHPDNWSGGAGAGSWCTTSIEGCAYQY